MKEWWEKYRVSVFIGVMAGVSIRIVLGDWGTPTEAGVFFSLLAVGYIVGICYRITK